MTKLTENNIKELKDLITAFRGDVSTRLTAIETRLTVIETRLDTWKPSIDKISDLAEKVGEIKNWRQIAFVIITATIGGVVGWPVKGGSLKP